MGRGLYSSKCCWDCSIKKRTPVKRVPKRDNELIANIKNVHAQYNRFVKIYTK